MSLSALKMDKDVEKATDNLGGGALDTNVYKLKVKTVYFGKSDGGAMSATLIGDLEDGSEFKSTQWITSGKAKGGKPYYERNGKKYPLPGYSIIDDLCQLTIGMSVGDAETEEKSVGIYDFELQKDVATEVECLADIKGMEVYLAIQKQLVDKTAENPEFDDSKPANKDTNKLRLPTGETREENEVIKVMSEDGATWKEISDDAESQFGEKWLTKNKGKVRDRTDKSGAAGSAGAPKKSAKKKMFAN